MIRSLVVAIAFSGTLFMCGPLMPAGTVHAESCLHENNEWVTLVKPTCSKYGKMVSICQDCEEILETEIIEKEEHKAKWEKTREATCTVVGIKSYVCKNCEAVIDTEEIPMKSHKFVRKSTTSATCQAPRTIEKACSTCGLATIEQIGNRLEHSFKWKVTKPATCAAEGIKLGTCKMCHVTKVEHIATTGKHKYGNWSIKLIRLKGKNIMIAQTRACKVCNKNGQVAECSSALFSGKHSHSKYYYKYTRKTGKIVILCPACHKSVTSRISGGNILFSKPKKDNSRATSKGWKEVKK